MGYKAATRGFDFEGMIKALKEDATPGAHVLLHACAHNPTGVDPTEQQWKEIADVMQEKKLMPLMDSAYQGYASGSLDKDAFATRLFVSRGFEMFLCQSFAKNLGLLRKGLEDKGTPGTWNHITDQIGMFSYTGLNKSQVDRMVGEFSIYMTSDGRISIAGLNPGNVPYVAECIDTV